MKYKGLLVGPMSGSMNGVTASHNAGGQYLRARVVPVNGNTPQQQAVRGYFLTLAGKWNSLLTGAQRTGWDAYGAAVGTVDALGDPRQIAGMAAYIMCNVPRLQAGLTRVDAPPSVLVKPEFTLPVYTVTAPSTGSLAFTNTDPWAGEVGGGLLLWSAMGQGTGVNYFKGPYRYAGKVAGAGTPPTTPQSIGPAFSVVAGQRVFYKVRCSRADGRLSGAAFLLSTAG